MVEPKLQPLIARLRQLARRQRQYGAPRDEQIDKTCDLTLADLDEAADALEALSAENARLKGALGQAQQALAWAARRMPPSYREVVQRDADHAAAALKEPRS